MNATKKTLTTIAAAAALAIGGIAIAQTTDSAPSDAKNQTLNNGAGVGSPSAGSTMGASGSPDTSANPTPDSSATSGAPQADRN